MPGLFKYVFLVQQASKLVLLDAWSYISGQHQEGSAGGCGKLSADLLEIYNIPTVDRKALPPLSFLVEECFQQYWSSNVKAKLQAQAWAQGASVLRSVLWTGGLLRISDFLPSHACLNHSEGALFGGC